MRFPGCSHDAFLTFLRGDDDLFRIFGFINTIICIGSVHASSGEHANGTENYG